MDELNSDQMFRVIAFSSPVNEFINMLTCMIPSQAFIHSMTPKTSSTIMRP